jgi:hypothetical protein
MKEIRESAIGFEAVKASMSQTKQGIALRLIVHPNDCPPELHTDWVGTRYMVAMVRLNDQDEPETRENERHIEKLIASAGFLCRNLEFQGYLSERGLIEEYSERAAVAAIREYCGIKSRAEIRDNAQARARFEELRGDFIKWKKS